MATAFFLLGVFLCLFFVAATIRRNQRSVPDKQAFSDSCHLFAQQMQDGTLPILNVTDNRPRIKRDTSHAEDAAAVVSLVATAYRMKQANPNETKAVLQAALFLMALSKAAVSKYPNKPPYVLEPITVAGLSSRVVFQGEDTEWVARVLAVASGILFGPNTKLDSTPIVDTCNLLLGPLVANPVKDSLAPFEMVFSMLGEVAEHIAQSNPKVVIS